MSKIIFIKCSNEKCEAKKSYPVEVGQEELLAWCPQCDPKGHKSVRYAKQQAKMVSNKAKRQSFDEGRVQSLDDGMTALVEDGVDLIDGVDGLGVEVDKVHEKYVPPVAAGQPEIPVITKDQAKEQALSPQQKAAITRAKNKAAKKGK